MKKFMFLFSLLLLTQSFVFAQTPINIDLPSLITLGVSIFLAGLFGRPITSIVAQLKRMFNAHGCWVVFISICVSAGCVAIYLWGIGWNTLHFFILTAVVAFMANGVHLDSKRRNPL